MAASNIAQETPEKMVKTVQHVFGEHPEDVIASSKWASDTLDWLDELFSVIKELADKDEQSNKHRISKLAAIGQYVAADFANLTGSHHGGMLAQMKNIGVVTE